jgi:hypothetical protein
MSLTKLSTYSPLRIGLFQALGVATYVLLFGLTVNSSDNWAFHPPLFLQIMITLLAITFSALTTGMLVLGYPLILVIRGEVKRGVSIVLWSGAWLAVIGMLAVLTAIAFPSNTPS